MKVVVDTCRAVWQAVPEAHRADLSKNALERGIEEAVGRGWTQDALVAYLARDLDRDRLPAASVHSRLRELPAIAAPVIRIDRPEIPITECEFCDPCGANLTYGHPHTAGCVTVESRAALPPLTTRPAPAGPETVRAAVAHIRAELNARRAS